MSNDAFKKAAKRVGIRLQILHLFVAALGMAPFIVAYDLIPTQRKELLLFAVLVPLCLGLVFLLWRVVLPEWLTARKYKCPTCSSEANISIQSSDTKKHYFLSCKKCGLQADTDFSSSFSNSD